MRHRRLVQHLTAAVLIAAIACELHGLSREFELSVDEPAWITASYTTLQLLRRAASPEDWATAYDRLRLGDWGNRNPPVGKLIFGLAVERAIEPGDRVEYRWTWGDTLEVMAARQQLPPPRVLMAARDGTVACAALCLLFAYSIAVQICSVPWLPLLAPIALYMIPVFRLHAAVVYTDIPQLMFLLAASLMYLLFCSAGRIAGWLDRRWPRASLVRRS